MRGTIGGSGVSLRVHHLLVLVERRVRAADRHRGKGQREARHCPSAVHRISVQLHAGGPAAGDVEVDHQRVLDRPMRRDPAAIERDRVGGRPLEPHQAAPVVEDRELAAGRDEQQHALGRLAVVAGDQGLAHVVRRERDARAVADLARQLPSGDAPDVGRRRRVPSVRTRTDRSRHRGTPEVAVAEDLLLRRLRPPRGDLERVGGGQGDAPARGDVAARQLLDDAHERRRAELVPPVAPRDVAAVEAGVHAGLVDLLGRTGAPFGLGRLLAQQRSQRDRSVDHLLRGEIGLRRRDPAVRPGVGTDRHQGRYSSILSPDRHTILRQSHRRRMASPASPTRETEDKCIRSHDPRSFILSPRASRHKARARNVAATNSRTTASSARAAGGTCASARPACTR